MVAKSVICTAAGLAFLTHAITIHMEAAAQDARHEHKPASHAYPVPSSIEAEHKELHQALARVIKSGGKTATAAKEVEKLLAYHFVKEEQYALPPLGLLSSLAAGKVPADAADITKLTDQLKIDMPQMLAEHKEIVAALQRLREAAKQERKHAAVEFADHLTAHATQEEQILYPSAILVGEYLKLKPK